MGRAADRSTRVFRRSRVLLMSKDPSLLDPLKQALDVFGLASEGVRSKARTLTELARRRHSAVLLDVDGLEEDAAGVVGRIREHHPDRFVIVAASRPTESLLADLLRAGTHRVLPKPLNPSETARIIRDACDAPEPPAAGPGRRRAGDLEAGPVRMPYSQGISASNQRLQIANELLRRQVSQLTILYQMGRDISENENWSDALDRFLMALVNYAKADGASLLLYSRNGERLSARANFHVSEAALSQASAFLGRRWNENPRGYEIHCLESYEDSSFGACLERVRPWRLTVIPLRYRSRLWGFLLIEKRYRSNAGFRGDYPFLSTIQTILAEEVANASYISDLRQLSRFNQKVLDNIQSGVITTDTDGVIVFWNHVALDMCPALNSSTRSRFDDVFQSAKYPGGMFEAIMDAAQDTQVLDVEYVGVRRAPTPGRLSTTKMHDDNLNATVLVGIFEDLTEQRKLEAEIRRMDRLRVLGQLSAGVAHEIRNPLTGIATSAEVLGGRLAGDKERFKYVRAILDETTRLDEIIRNLLSFARPARPQIRPCALSDVCSRVASLLSDQASKKGIALRVHDRLGERACLADANQLTQVLLNLVLNAIDACDRGNTVAIELGYEIEPTAPEEGFVRIDVCDDGPGVSVEVRDRLFEPFVTTKTHGTGLGLAISQQIVEEHRGTIRCERCEKGTRFTIRLPLGTANTAPPAPSP
jgi:signal transduction histidine kinase/ActR/RegA family two-component response regulator